MMKAFRLLGVCFAVVASAFAGPIPTCISGTYASYEALSNGCVVNNLLFTNFSDVEEATAPAVILTTSAITVAPDFFALDEGLDFNSSWSVSGSGQLGSILTYTVQTLDNSNTLSGTSLSFNGVATGGGGAGVITTYCVGSSLGTTSCPTTDQIITVTEPIGPSTAPPQTYGPTNVLSVSNQIVVAANGGMAAISVVDTNYAQTAIPEPMTFTLLAGGLIGIGLLRKRR